MSVIVIGPNVDAFTLADSSIGGTDQLGGTPTATTSVTISVDQTQTPTLTRVDAFLRTLSPTETQTPTLTMVASHPLTVTVDNVQVPSLAAPFVPGGGSTTLQDVAATQTQDVLIQYSVVRVPTQSGGGSPKKKSVPETLSYKRRMNFSAHQTASLVAVLEPVGLPLAEDDELAVLLLI